MTAVDEQDESRRRATSSAAGVAYTRGMCMQCVAGAMTAGAAATGMRAWLAARFGHLLTPARKKAMTAALIGAGLLLAGAVGPTP